jgi:cytochrome P450
MVRCESESLGYSFWVITDHARTKAVLSDTTSFTSERGMMLLAAAEGDPAGGRMLVATDPPHHTDLRKIFSRGLSRAVLEGARSRVHQTIVSLLDEAEDRQIDFMEDVAAAIPVTAICSVLGVPPEDEHFLYDRTRVAFGAEDPSVSNGRDASSARGAAHVEILLYFEELIREKRRSPCDDLLTVLAHAEVHGEPLPVGDILVNCDNVLLGGNETTRYALGNTLFSMVEQESSWETAYQGGYATQELVEELLRWTSPGQHVMRTALCDVEILGTQVQTGERVTCWIPSANRDEEAFDRAATLDLTRKPNPHLTFGSGPHYCWGAAFAKMEIAAFVSELVERQLRPGIVSPPERLRSTVMNGFRTLPVAFAR